MVSLGNIINNTIILEIIFDQLLTTTTYLTILIYTTYYTNTYLVVVRLSNICAKVISLFVRVLMDIAMNKMCIIYTQVIVLLFIKAYLR